VRLGVTSGPIPIVRTMTPTPITRTARPVFRGREMRVLRLLSMAAGVFAILLPAALLASTAHGIPDWLEPYIVLVGVARHLAWQ
jgi:hypothetical protein